MGYAKYLDILKEYSSDNELKKHLIVLETCDAQRMYMDAMARYNYNERMVREMVECGECNTEEQAREILYKKKLHNDILCDIVVELSTSLEVWLDGVAYSYLSPLLGGRVLEDVYVKYDGDNTMSVSFEWLDEERIYTVEEFLKEYGKTKFIIN